MSHTGIANCVGLDIRHPCYEQLRAVKMEYPARNFWQFNSGVTI